ncbi:MAG: DUF4292 domain-containing protein [Ginsengibacter sp.]
MIKYQVKIIFGILLLCIAAGCRSTKKLQTAINKRDSNVVVVPGVSNLDSLKGATNVLRSLEKNRINFTTFSAKIKVQYEDKNGKQPDFNAFVRLYKDSVLWITISATFLGIEAFRILITKDSIIIVNKLDKKVEFHSFSYVENIAHIPLNFSTLQDLVVGNPIYVGDSVVAFRQTENRVLIGTVGKFFKNLLTATDNGNYLIERSKLDDLDISQNRTGDLTYGEYQKNNNMFFATYREITVAEKTKVDISLSFKQYEFNKELSFPFTIPKSYKIK